MSGEVSCACNMIFVVGHARSGTSLVNKLLLLHPDTAGGNETRLFKEFARMVADSDRRGGRSGLFSFHPGREFPLALIRSFVVRYFEEFARIEGKRHVVEKTPSHFLSLERIKDCFPDARIVYCVRDGREVWLSHKQMAAFESDWAKIPLEEVADTWKRSVEIAIGQDLFDADHFRLLRHEDLRLDPLGETRSLYEHCGLTPSAVEPAAIDAAVEQNANLRARPGYHPGYAGRWEAEMPSDERARFEAIAGQALLDAGYQSTHVPTGSRREL